MTDYPWTQGKWTIHDANEGTDYFPMWCVANDAFHNPPSDEDEPWLAVELHVGGKADAQLVALAPEMAAAILAWTANETWRGETDTDPDSERLYVMGDKLRGIIEEGNHE